VPNRNLIIALVVLLGLGSKVAAQTTQPQVNEADRTQAAELTKGGWQLWQQQSFEDAVERFQQAVELDPTNQNAWNGLGWSRFNGGNSAQAKIAFEKLVEMNPKHPAALNGLGQIYLSQGQLAQAEEFLLRCSDQASAAWFGLARLYLLQEKYDDALKWAQKIVDNRQFGDSEEFVRRMLDAAKNRQLDDQLRAMIAPHAASDASRQVLEAFQLMQKGQMDEARKLLEQAFETAPDDVEVLNGYGWFRMNVGEAADAQPLFERALELQPLHGGALNGLAQCHKQRGEIDKAIELWKKMLEISPGANAGMYSLAETYLERGEFDKALPLYEKLAKAQPDNEAIQAGLTRARDGLKR
jgi:tetratricopeptide (TPR) repeat protein